MASLQISASDKKLGITGLVCLIFALIAFPYVQPEFQIPYSLDKQEVAQRSTDILEELGFTLPAEDPDIRLVRNQDFLKEYVNENGKKSLRRLLKNDSADDVIFYNWRVSHTISDPGEDRPENPESPKEEDRQTGSLRIGTSDGFVLDLEDESVSTITLNLGMRGELVGLRSTGLFIPGFADSLAYYEGVLEDEQAFMTRQAEQLLGLTVWGEKNPEKDKFSRSSPDTDGFFEFEATFLIQDTPVPTHVALGLKSSGEFVSIRYEMAEESEASLAENIFKGVVYGFFAFLIIVFYLVQFFRRMYNRLLDLRLARFDAIGFGLLLAAMVAIAAGFAEAGGTTETYFVLLIGIAVFLGFGLFFIAVGFPAFATTESLNQEAWPEKKHALTLLKHGFIKNRLVGQSLGRGVVGGCILAAILVLIYALNPYAWFLPFESDNVALSDSVPLSFLNVFISFIVSSIFLVLIYLSAPAAWFQINKMNPYLSVFLLVLLVAPLMHLTPETGSFFADYFFMLLLAVVPVLLFLKYDQLCAITALFTYALVIVGISSFVIPGFSDLLILFISVGLFGLIIAAGYVGLRSDNTEGRLPDLEPEYIKKLVREKRIEKEFELAREVHDSFLTSSAADIPGFDISASCKTAYEVGGDYFDFIPVDEHRTLIVIADVSGKGVKAAFYMTLLKGYLQAVTEYHSDIRQIMSTVNRLFHASTPKGTFITALAGILDQRTNTFTFIRAGHDPLYLLDKSSSGCRVYRPDGFALGMVEQKTFDIHTAVTSITVEPDHAVLLFTDGYPESFNSKREQYGEKRLEQVSAHLFRQHLTSAGLMNAIHNKVASFVGSAQQHDDMTMIVIRRDKPSS